MTSTHRRGWIAGALGLLALPRLAKGERPTLTPEPHRLDRLHDDLVATWVPTHEAEVIYERDLDGAWNLGLERAERDALVHQVHDEWERHRSRRWRAYRALEDAVLQEAGIEIPTVMEYRSVGRPVATVRTARRVYAVLPDCGGEWCPEHGLSYEVVAIDL